MKNRLAKFLGCLILAAAIPCFAGSFTDTRDGQTYKTVKIGSQTWMAQNMNYSTGAGHQWCYDGKTFNCKKYGHLYDWNAALRVCPAGWHLPSKSDFEKLLSAVGDKRVAGKKLKSKKGWWGNGNGTDSFGFTALPAGSHHYYYSVFTDEGTYALFWTTTEYDRDEAYRLGLLNRNNYADFDHNKKGKGYSVRCLRNSR